MNTLSRALLAAAASAPFASAQAFTITDGNMTFGWGPAATAGTFHATTSIDASTCNAADNVYAWHWAYAVVGSPGRPIDDTGHGSYTQQVTSPVAIQTFTNVDALGKFDATTLDLVDSTGPNNGSVLNTLTVTNTSGAQLDLRVYVFMDADYEGTTVNWTLPQSGPNRFLLDSPTTACVGCMDWYAEAPTHWQVGAFGSTNGPAATINLGANLTNAGLPWSTAGAGADFTGAFEWLLVLAPGGSRTLTTIIGDHDLFAGNAAASNHLGTALGAPTAPTLTAPLPVLGLPSIALTVGSGGAAPNATLLFGFDAAPVQVPFLGLGIMVPASGIVASANVALSAGTGSLTLPLGCDPRLAGIPICVQAFVQNAASPAGLPLLHTDLLVAVIGD